MMDEKKSDKGKKFLRSAIVVVCSAFAGSAAQIFVMIPNGLTSGGLPGIVRIITHFMPWNYSLVYYCFGMAVVALVYFTLGWKDVQKIIALSIAYPVIMYGMEQVDFCLLSHKDPFWWVCCTAPPPVSVTSTGFPPAARIPSPGSSSFG